MSPMPDDGGDRLPVPGDTRGADPGRRKADQERAWTLTVCIGCAGIALICALICLVVSGTVLANRHDIVHTQDIVTAVQQERARVTRSSCLDQNARHKVAVARLNALVRSSPDRPVARRMATRALIDAIVPLRDCERRVQDTVKAGSGRAATPTPSPVP